MNTFKKFFNESFKESVKVKESIMDYPRGEMLCSDIWDDNEGTYVLKDNVRELALKMANWAIEKYNLKNPLIRLIGSICSNTYTDDADIDIHITDTSLSKEDKKELNKKLAEDFKAQFKTDDEDNKSKISINNHPIELYIQENPYTDLLSVGCYDLKENEWLEGPTIYPSDYDPFEKYYEKIYTVNEELIKDIRDFILSVKEYAFTVKLSKDSSDDFKLILKEMISSIIETASTLLEDSRNMRGALTDPKSEDDAASIKENEGWKLSDATFKLLGKFGYISVLKKLSNIENDISIEEASEKINEICSDKLFTSLS